MHEGQARANKRAIKADGIYKARCYKCKREGRQGQVITVKEETFETAIGSIYRATLMVDGKDFLSYKTIGDSARAFGGLVNYVEKFRQEALTAISEHIKDTERDKG